jgi:hypothetical protein
MKNVTSINKFFRVLWVLGFMISLSSYSQNAPVTIAPDIYADPGSTIDVPILVSDFNNIGAVSLTLNYDSSVLVFQSAAYELFPELTIDNPTPGTIIIGGFESSAGTGITLADSSVLFTLTFVFQGGSTGINWSDNGSSCEYSGPSPSYIALNDTPQATYYLNGSLSQFPIPGSAGPITGPLGGNVCAGQTGVIFSIVPILNATDYIWSLPYGATVTGGGNSNEISVSFSYNASDGNVTVYGINSYGFGAISPPFPIVVNKSPEILTQPVSPEPVDAGSGIATFNLAAEGSGLVYQWQEFILDWLDIAEGGVYSGSGTESLLLTNPPFEMNGFRYRCMINGFCDPETATDGNAQLTVTEMLGIESAKEVWNKKTEFTLFPNPCKDKAIISYYLPETCYVTLVVCNPFGVSVETSIFHSEQQGYYEKEIETDQFVPGIYTAILRFVNANYLSESTVKFIKNK